MVCGKDAADKGGTRRYNGCGRRFRWTEAPKYEIETVFTLPKPPNDALGIRAGTTFPFTRKEFPTIPSVFNPLTLPLTGLGARVCLRCEREVKETCFQCIRCPPALVTRTQAGDALRTKFQAFARGLDGPIAELWKIFLESTPVAELQLALTVTHHRLPVSYCWDCMRHFLQSSTPDDPRPLDKVVHTSLKERVCTPQTCCFRILQPQAPPDMSQPKSQHGLLGPQASLQLLQPQDQQQPKQVTMQVKTVRWEFPDRTHWSPFDETVSATLEDAFKAKERDTVVEVLGGWHWFDVDRNLLINVSNNKSLIVRRVASTKNVVVDKPAAAPASSAAASVVHGTPGLSKSV